MKKRVIIIGVICLLVFVAGAFSYRYRTELKNEAARIGLFKEAAPSAPPETKAALEEAKQPEETPTVEIPTDKQQMIGVRTVKAAIQPLNRVIRTVGRIEYDERKLATVNTKIEGWIEKLHVDYTGRYVKKGEPLVEIYSPELVATQQEFLNVLRWAGQGQSVKDERTSLLLVKDAQAMLEAAKERLRLWDISDEQIKKIETTGKPIRTLTIYTPVSGYILQKMAVQGMRVMPGEKLFDVVDLSSVWIVADIYEYELPLIKVGQPARIGLSYFPGQEFSSRVDYVYPALASETRTAKVRFTIPNPKGALKPQMFTSVEIKINLGSRLAVPAEAVIDTGARQIVYVDKGEGYFEPREVSTGLKVDELVEITGGIKAGEKVASSANFLIDSEAQLKGVAPLPMKRK
ncbi:MAG: efflux RND transporter periplasmic adaptor subunit [Syntrophales bacterium]|jgi:Cu(I)/Ag(I) efflux system membrane fusion protein|nr:efflux RND transporter periplasmic adaptor subunit [Syntrophales bacterium]